MPWTISATDFKARCLDILDEVASGQLDRVVITQGGRPAVVLTPSVGEADNAEPHREDVLHGALRGSVLIPIDVDLTAPTFSETFTAESGQIHG